MLKVLLVCRSCGFTKDLEGSEESLPDSCPFCGSKDLEFVVFRKKLGKDTTVDDVRKSEEMLHEFINNLVKEVFLKQVSPGEWEIDLGKTMSEDVAVAEIEPGEYEIVFRGIRRVG
ncbi:MAG: hypothetical protein J7L91_01710 [Candidatus Korarchaeota archaeon]|nr:hypothetical protein [Candidatus Korarchaeota archaeon]